jgi:hypothetical protein
MGMILDRHEWYWECNSKILIDIKAKDICYGVEYLNTQVANQKT